VAAEGTDDEVEVIDSEGADEGLDPEVAKAEEEEPA
jgi:hypothetical protein